MADDDAIIRRRLLTRTSTVGKTGIKKCAETMLTLVDLLMDKSVDDVTCKQEMEALYWEMEHLEFEAKKTEIWNYTCDRELEEYETLNREIDASITKVMKEIEELKQKMIKEKMIRAYKEEYESIARVVNELPSRKEILVDIQDENKRLEDATTALEAVDGKLDMRIKQFALLMSTIQNLKATLDEDTVVHEDERQEDEDMEEEVEAKNAVSVNENGRSPSAS
ncbi:unnamed protein product [Peronospora belbahrii]|uniref:THO complex subunit 7 homolog n=1 Tax=Peronospora belbahrii TaxID=622444 RepID=A0AAU9KXV4_9STRA|nr:unnamed protein product [Peronospora belbahrii]CAH0516204.1 unnamed protein product [Peronospora belbahrii]